MLRFRGAARGGARGLGAALQGRTGRQLPSRASLAAQGSSPPTWGESGSFQNSPCGGVTLEAGFGRARHRVPGGLRGGQQLVLTCPEPTPLEASKVFLGPESSSQPEPAPCHLSTCPPGTSALSGQASGLAGLTPIRSTFPLLPPRSWEKEAPSSVLQGNPPPTKGCPKRGRSFHHCSHLFTKTKGKPLEPP